MRAMRHWSEGEGMGGEASAALVCARSGGFYLAAVEIIPFDQPRQDRTRNSSVRLIENTRVIKQMITNN